MLEPQLPIHCVPPPGNNPTSARLSGSPTEAPFAASAATVTTRWRPLHQPDSPPPPRPSSLSTPNISFHFRSLAVTRRGPFHTQLGQAWCVRRKGILVPEGRGRDPPLGAERRGVGVGFLGPWPGEGCGHRTSGFLEGEMRNFHHNRASRRKLYRVGGGNLATSKDRGRGGGAGRGGAGR